MRMNDAAHHPPTAGGERSGARATPPPDGFVLDALVTPAELFGHPWEVVHHPGLTRDEKRAILASWASDAYAVESAPGLRQLPGSPRPVRLAEVLAALRQLDPDGWSEPSGRPSPARLPPMGLGRWYRPRGPRRTDQRPPQPVN